MKRLTSFLMVFALLFSMMPTVFAAGGAEGGTPTPDKIDAQTVWSYLDNSTDPAGDPAAEGYNRTSWTAADFDDSTWKTGSGSFGAKNDGTSDGADHKLDGCSGSSNYPTYYFRTKVNVSDANAVTKITGTIAFDDSVIVYINGKKAFSYNDEGADTNSSYCANKSTNKQTESFEITDREVLNKLESGTNVIAVELHNQAANSSDIWFAMSDMTFSTEPLPTTNTLLNGDSQWQYLDDGTDPAGGASTAGYDRTSWTAETFDTTSWKPAKGPFGAKNGVISDLSSGYIPGTLLAQYKEGTTTDIEAYFFRTAFNVTSMEGMTKLTGTLQYDDGAIVYLNGQRVAAFDDNACDENGTSLGTGFTANLQYGGSNGGTPKTVSFELLDLSILHTGENTIAVELHNGRKTSSDVWFYLTDLSLSDEKVEYQSNVSLSMGADESKMNFTWYSPLSDAQLLVADNAGMTNAQTVSAAAVNANDGQYSCKATAIGLTAGKTYYYQLSNGGHTSETCHFTTDDGGAFSFAFVGDPQIGASGNTAGDTANWETALNSIKNSTIFSDVSFLMSAGDQVNTASDEAQYDGYLNHSVLTGLPVATAIGNHDSSSNAYSQHFNVPNESESGKTAAGGDYYFTYNNALFMVLNSNAQSEADVAAHKAFMEAAVDATRNDGIQWKIVMFHHTLFTVASHAHDGYIDNADGFKAKIIPVLKELDVDVVLSGHDHVYCRTYMMNGTEPIIQSEKYEYGKGEGNAPTAVNDPTGILYVTANTGSGSKTYGILDEQFNFSAVQNQDNKANVSKVTVSDKQFTITTYRTSDMAVVDSFTIKRDGGDPQPASHLLIEQVYGGGGKGETPISNSFIELYNPTSTEINLSSYSLVYGDKTLTLTGTIPVNGSYLVVGAAEATTDEFLSYDLPKADQTCDWVINNKSYTIKLMNGESEIDSVTAGDSDATKVSKQKSLKRINHADTDTNEDFQISVWEKESATVDDAYVAANAPHNSKREQGSVHTASSEPVYTPVVTGNTRVTGYNNTNGSLKLTLAGRYNSGAMNADGGSLEIVQYNPVNGFAYAVSGVKGKLIAVDLNSKLDGGTVVELNGTEYDLKAMVTKDGFTYGDMTSVAISPDGTKLAAALQHADYTSKGAIAVFTCNKDGSLTLLSTAEVGVQPDMVTFADNSTILSADEGEPRGGVNGTDPKGSVSIVTIDENNALTANTVYFDSFNTQRDALTTKGVLIQKNAQPSTDFEPEYIAVSGGTAYVSLQEANAIAVLDIATKTFTGIYPLGFQDYSTTKVDLQKNGTIDLKNYPNVYGIRMPDGISVTTIGGKTYLLTANEGDSRADWTGLDNEYENVTSPTGSVTPDEKVVWFNTDMWDGLDSEKDYVFGGRSFSIYEAAANGLELVYDSGSDFEEITAEKLPDYFNCSNDKISQDNRSGKKGPEPESVITGTVDGKTYAFVALERIGGVMVYDITDPANAKFVNYINSREFDDAVKGDVSPEGLCFIPADKSKTGKALLLAACEVSGTLAVYELAAAQPISQSTGSGSGSSGSASYQTSVAPASNGSVSISNPSAKKGSTVTLNVQPDKGYMVETITVTDSSGNKIPVTEEDGKYTFIMPASKVTVTASFVEEPAEETSFTDVSSDAYYHDAVQWAVAKGITEGTTSATFSPAAACTRAQAVTFLWRAAGSPAPKSAAVPFSDVASDAYYRDAVLWAAENGITRGSSDTTFSPDATCTRGQIVTFLWRSQNSPAGSSANPFNDVAADDYYGSAVLWAAENGITGGTGPATFSPVNECTRAQIVTFLFRCME